MIKILPFPAVVVAVLVGIVLYDQAVLYLYLPRQALVLAIAVIVAPVLFWLAPTRLAAVSACIAAALSIYLVAPIALTDLKQFYRDCAEIRAGETSGAVARRMDRYETSLTAWGTRQPSSITDARRNSGDTPFIFIPSPKYESDFCMVYLRNGVVDRVELSPD